MAKKRNGRRENAKKRSGKEKKGGGTRFGDGQLSTAPGVAPSLEEYEIRKCLEAGRSTAPRIEFRHYYEQGDNI